MSDVRELEMVSAAADEALDAHARGDLARLLERSPEARRFQADIRNLESILARVPDPTPPDSLHERLTAQVSRAGAAPARISRFRRREDPAALRYGFALAAGVLLTMGFYEVASWPGGRADYDEVVGTVASGDQADGRIVDVLDIGVAGMTGRIELRRTADSLDLDISSRATGPVEISADFSTAGLRPVGVMQDDLPFESLLVADRVLRWRTTGGGRMKVLLRRVDDTAIAAEARIRLEISRDGEVLQQGSLSPAR